MRRCALRAADELRARAEEASVMATWNKRTVGIDDVAALRDRTLHRDGAVDHV